MADSIRKVIKFHFTAPVHFGADTPGVGVEKVNMTCRADTLFSALCCEALELFGAAGVQELFEFASSGRIMLSDLFPFDKNELYLPKPVLSGKQSEAGTAINSVQKKKLKKLKYISLEMWPDYLEMMNGSDKFSVERFESFAGAKEIMHPKVHKQRNGDDSQPFAAGAYTFDKENGLYFIGCFADDAVFQKITTILTSLQYSGIGGERSSGWGKFEISICDLPDDFPEFAVTDEFGYVMALSCVSPADDELGELQRGYYTIARREGFVLSATYAKEQLKRQSLHMINSGSCFSKPLVGTIREVSQKGGHPVYRYGKGLFIVLAGDR